MTSPASESADGPKGRMALVHRKARALGILLGITERRRSELPAALGAGISHRWLAFMLLARVWSVLARLAGRRGPVRKSALTDSPVGHVSAEQLAAAAGLARATTTDVASASPLPVPRIIFQTWKSRIRMPADFAAWSATLRRAHPDWLYARWDDADNRAFIQQYHAWFLPVYDAYPREILRADAVRYFFLFQFGGLYVDMDTECLRPVAGLFDDSTDIWLGRMGHLPGFAHSIPNAMMAARPRQEFWLLVMHLMVKAAHEGGSLGERGVEAMTGPILLKQAHDLYVASEHREAVDADIRNVASHYAGWLPPTQAASRVRLLPASDWYPINWSNVIHNRLQWELTQSALARPAAVRRWLFPTSTLVTYWSHTWGR